MDLTPGPAEGQERSDEPGERVSERLCEVSGCTKRARGKMCRMHRSRLERRGTTEPTWRCHAPKEERFWRRVDRSGDCWLWTGNRNHHGYGYFADRSSHKVGAHRFSYQLHFGSIPDGMHVLHRCDNPPCVNPAHLFLGTRSDNMADMVAKRRGSAVPGEAHPAAKITDAQVLELRRLASQGVTYAELAARYGLNREYVGMLARGEKRPL